MTDTYEMSDLKEVLSLPESNNSTLENAKDQNKCLLTEQHLREIFNKFDTNSDNHITPDELRVLLKKAGIKGYISTKKLNGLIARADKNNDNQLNFDEFQELVKSGALPANISELVNEYVHTIIPPRYSGQYEKEYKLWPPPVALITLSLIVFLMFVIDLGVTNDPYAIDGPVAYVTVYDPYRRYEFWRYISYTIVHVGWVHLFVNLGVLLLLGIPLEMVHRWWRVLIVFLSGVIFGSLLTSVTYPDVFLAGASSGVYAILTAHIATIIMNWTEMKHPLIQLIVLLLIIAVDCGRIIYAYMSSLETQVGYISHLGGAIAGLLVGIYVLRNLLEKKWEKYIFWIAVTLYAVLLIICIVWNIAFPSYFPPPYYD